MQRRRRRRRRRRRNRNKTTNNVEFRHICVWLHHLLEPNIYFCSVHNMVSYWIALYMTRVDWAVLSIGFHWPAIDWFWVVVSHPPSDYWPLSIRNLYNRSFCLRLFLKCTISNRISVANSYQSIFYSHHAKLNTYAYISPIRERFRGLNWRKTYWRTFDINLCCQQPGNDNGRVATTKWRLKSS